MNSAPKNTLPTLCGATIIQYALLGDKMATTHQIYFKDSQRMAEVQNESVHLVVTSPPYGYIKDYGNPLQIGFYDSLSTYLHKLGNVWAECIRALKPGCRMCINIGDQYVRKTKDVPYQIVPLHAHLVSGLMARHSDQMVYLGSIIWQKISNTKTTGGASVMGSYPFPRNGYVSYNYEYIALFKKKGDSIKISPTLKPKLKMGKRTWRTLHNGIWTFQGARQIDGMAMFPDELPKRLLKMFTCPDDTVLDPFLGSGTTTKVAFEMKRNSVGYDIGQSDLSKTVATIKRKCHYYDVSASRRMVVFPTLV